MDTLLTLLAALLALFQGYGPVVIGWLFNLAYMVTAVVTVFWMLRYLDKRLGVNFRERVLPILEKEPMALALYRAAWILGACVLAGLMLGAGGGA